jgi:hypothetical protein
LMGTAYPRRVPAITTSSEAAYPIVKGLGCCRAPVESTGIVRRRPPGCSAQATVSVGLGSRPNPYQAVLAALCVGVRTRGQAYRSRSVTVSPTDCRCRQRQCDPFCEHDDCGYAWFWTIERAPDTLTPRQVVCAVKDYGDSDRPCPRQLTVLPRAL